MVDNVAGGDNTALGANALGTNQGGSNNIAIGFNAGYHVRGGRYNIEIGTDPKAGRQYGLIAEEVAKVYPELVIRNEAGQAEGVRYEELTPILLNEIQQLQERVRAMQRRQAELRDMQQQLADLQEFRRSIQERAARQ